MIVFLLGVKKTMGQVLKGVVKWFNDAKGFGFIEHESGQDVFVHYSVIEQDGFKTLKDGEPVEYELREGDKGLNASRVSRVNIANSIEASTSSQSDPSLASSVETVQASSAATNDQANLNLEVQNTTSPAESVAHSKQQPQSFEPAKSEELNEQ